MIDFQQIQVDYATCYMDKTRIKFIEKYLSTFNATAGKSTPFMLFPRQKVFLKSLSENKASIAIKHRQCGITTISSAFICAQCVFAPKDAPETVLCIANKLDMANDIINKIRDFLLQVPRWYWGDDYYSTDPKSEKNKRDIFVKNSKSMLELFNGCKIYARSSGANAARGISAVSLLIFDEAAFIEDGLAVYSSAVAATASNPNAKIIMVSTPNGKDELYYNTYKQALAKENNYNAIEFKWYQDLRYNKFLEWHRKDEKTGEDEVQKEPILDESGTVPYDEEKWRKLEREGWQPDSPWYSMMKQSFNNDSMKIAQELDVSFMGSANNVVDPKSIEQQEQFNVREPLTDFKDPLVEETWFWKPPIEGHRYICACLPEGEKVMTQRGEVNIEDVQENDLLITKEGNLTSIKERKYRIVEDEDIVEIKLHNILDTLKFTHNHPIWCSNDNKNVQVNKKINSRRFRWREYSHKFEFNEASTITNESWVEIPNYYYINSIEEEEMKKHWVYESDNPLLDEDFWWYCGMWLAEGFCKYDGSNVIITVHNSNELEYHEKINNILSRLFNKNCNIYNRKNCKATDVIFRHANLHDFLSNNFGRYSYGKYIPEWIKFIPQRFKLKLIEGYFNGDGTFYKDSMNVISVSKPLIKDIQDILFSCGILSEIVTKKEHIDYYDGKPMHKREAYLLKIGKYYSNELLKKLGIQTNKNFTLFRQKMYFSKDLTKIYIKVRDVQHYKYSGKVYNFETESDSHTFCCRWIATHNCDPSRGVATDKTAIEIIDMDGRDENGMPILEQVMEYNGKKLGDDIGGLVFQYATMYNTAFVVFDATGGQADAAILAMMSMGYKNMYYEDANQKTYMLQNHQFSQSFNDRLPGFHFQGNRYPVLANFAGMVRNNEFKIRSIRVINELETWIFKGDTGRMDHMDGAHDDTICALAMALFVMQYSLNKIENIKNKDAAILSAYMMNSGMPTNNYRNQNSISMQPKQSLPFYNGKTLKKYSKDIGGSYLWLLSGMY